MPNPGSLPSSSARRVVVVLVHVDEVQERLGPGLEQRRELLPGLLRQHLLARREGAPRGRPVVEPRRHLASRASAPGGGIRKATISRAFGVV